MTETATIIKINNDIATLVCSDSSACTSCEAHSICGGVGDRTFDAWNANNLDLKVGNKVEFLLPTGKTIGSAFMVLIFPLLMFFAFFYASELLLESPGEGIKVLFGLGGISAGYGFNVLINRKPKKKSMPEIIKKLV